MIRKIVLFAVSGLLLIAVAGAVYVGTACPCEQMPGVALWGEIEADPVDDWSFVNDTGLCQLQVDNGVLPQSLNLNCMSSGKDLFISCSRCEGKRWSAIALSHPNGRIRIEGRVYPVILTRLESPDELDRAWAARAEKLRGLGREVDDQRPDHWWSFQLRSG